MKAKNYMKISNNKTESAIIRKLFASTVITMLITELTGSVSAVVDGIITGQFLGSTSLAASGLGAPYFSVACIISMMLMVGSTSRCTNAIGKGNKDELVSVFSLTILLASVLAIILSIAGIIFSNQLVILFGGSKASLELKNEAAAYLRGLFIGAPAFILFVIMTPLVQLDGNANIAKIGSIAMIITDVAGDLLNVTVFKGGMFGMGLATSIGHWVSFIIVLTHFLRKDKMLKFSFKAIKFKETPKIVLEGLPMVASMVGRALLPIILNTLIINKVGDVGTAAYSAMISASFVLGALGWGIGNAVMLLGGMLYSEQDIKEIKSIVLLALKFILIGVISISIIVFLTSPLIAKIFLPSGGESYEMLIEAYRFYALALPLIAFNVMMANYFQATKRRIQANLVNLSIEAVFTIISAVILINLFGIRGVWLAFPIGQLLLAVIITLGCVVFRDKTRKGFYSLLTLPEDFGVREEDTIECSVNTIEEVIKLSENINEFCLSHGFSKKETYRLALCIEEMAGNVIEHGFNDGKEHHLDIRIIYKNDNIVMRMRDDCRKFDFCEKAKKWSFNKEHPESNIGIRMVMKSAEKVDYTNALNTNNLILTIKRNKQ